jgi:hypothetical protein
VDGSDGGVTLIRLEDHQLEELADLIAERLRPPPPRPEMVDARMLAGILGVSLDAVYAAQVELGGVRVGKPGSKRPRIMFDVQTAIARREQPSVEREPPARIRRSRGRDGHVPLLPIRP